MSKRYDLDGVGSELELSKGGLKLKNDSGVLKVTANDGSTLVKLKGADATASTDFATKGQIDTSLASKENLVTGSTGVEKVGQDFRVKLSSAGQVNDKITISGASPSKLNGEYTLVKNGGVAVKGVYETSGSDLHFDMQTEVMRKITLSNLSSAFNKELTVSLQTHTGYMTNTSGNTWMWSTGSTGGDFHTYYYNSTDKIFMAWDATNSVFRAFNLDNTSGSNSASFISDLTTGSGGTTGYISGSSTFTLDASSDSESTGTSAKDSYTDDSAIKVPANSASNITHSETPQQHNYYVYQNTADFHYLMWGEEAGYWTAFDLTSDLDLTSTTPADNADYAYTIGDTSYITGSSEDYGDGVNIPNDSDSQVTFSGTAGSASYMEIASNAIGVKVKDEDNFSSNSADHLATQQSIKAFVESKIVDEDNFASNSATHSPSQQSVKAYVY